jgi:hypothetical protein
MHASTHAGHPPLAGTSPAGPVLCAPSQCDIRDKEGLDKLFAAEK